MDDENSPQEIQPIEEKKISKAQAKRNRQFRSAIYQLTPSHRRFVLALRRQGWNQKQAYLEVFPHVTEVSAQQSAARLMQRPDIQRAIEEMYDEMSVVELESFEKVLSRFVREAETAEKSSDRIQASNYIAKLQRHMPDESIKNQSVILADTGLLDSLRSQLSKFGKLPPDVSRTELKEVDIVPDAQPEPPKSDANNS